MSRDFTCIPDVRQGVRDAQSKLGAEVKRLRDHGLTETAADLEKSVRFLQTFTGPGMMLDHLQKGEAE